MEFRSNKKSSGSIGGGCFLFIFALAGWGICALIFPKLPDYSKVMEEGEIVPGEVIRVEKVDNVTINGGNPKKVFYSYGDGKEASMMLAMRESTSAGKKIEVRVLGENAYPVDLRPLAKPRWVNYAVIGLAIFATFLIAIGILRLLLVGGVLVAAGHALLKDKKSNTNSDQPPPLSGPPPMN